MPYMSLRPLLSHFADDPDAPRFAREGGRAFVSASYRPFVIGALLDGVDGPLAGRPALVVAADDRQARDIAADLRHWLAPRPVRYYPSRGVAYESHLAPPPHLVGLRVAALDALLEHEAAGPGDDVEPPVVVVSAVALSEKVPDPSLRPKSFWLRVGELLDLDEVSADLVAAGYERVDQVADRGQFAIRGGILDVYPATADHAVRVDLFDIEIESLREFSTFTQRSLQELTELEIAPAAELAAEHRQAAEIAAVSTDAEDRPDVAELLPVDQFRAFLELAPADAAVLLAEEAELHGALTDHWQDVCAAFHAEDARDLYVKPEEIESALDSRAHARLSALTSDQPFAFRAQAADLAARSLREAEPQLEKQVRGGYRTVVTWPQRGAGERTAYNLARLKAHWLEDDGSQEVASGDLRFAVANLRDGFIAGGPRIAVIPEHRLFRRRRAERDDAEAAGRARRRGALPS
jgi:transcription-repair coupling factor (superfamily II helicase)